ncbi:MAG: glutathione transport system substrate-binding protein [Actinomycetota bacterium]
MKRTSRPLSIAALLLAIALVAGACGKSDNNKTSAGGGGGTGNGQSATENDVNATPRASVQDGGTLKWPMDGMPPNFNYNELDGPDANNANVIGALMPTPFDYQADSTPLLKKEYVESAEVTAKDPKQVVTYHLNPKAKWSDGTPITWADYEAQWKALNGKNDAYKVAGTSGYEVIESVAKGKDDYEVVVTYAEHFADWRNTFNPLYPASTNSDPKVFNEGWVDKPLVTAGPFKLDTIDQTAKTITLVRDDKWWGDKAKLDRIVFRTIDGDAQIDALANGEVDFIDVGADVNKYQRAKGTSGVELRKAGGPNFRHYDFNGNSEVFKDVRVRKAVALGIDRSTITKALLGPLGVDTAPLNNHIFMLNQKGYRNNAGELATPSATKAKALLDEAGWKPGPGGVRVKDGKPLAFRWVIPSGTAPAKQEAELVQGMLAPIGFKVNIDVVPSDPFFDQYVSPGNFDVVAFSWGGTPYPISSAVGIYHTVQGDDVQQNYGRIGDPKIDDLFSQATTELDPAKAIDEANHADKLIWDEVHSITSYQRPDIVAAKSTLANYGALGFASVRYEDVGFTK